MWYIKLENEIKMIWNHGASDPKQQRTTRRHAMKQKVCHAMQVMIAVTMEDIAFFVISGIALAIILKLACA